MKQDDGRAADMTDTTRHQSWQSTYPPPPPPLPDHAGSIPAQTARDWTTCMRLFQILCPFLELFAFTKLKSIVMSIIPLDLQPRFSRLIL